MRSSKFVLGVFCVLGAACGRLRYEPDDANVSAPIDAPGLDAAMNDASIDAPGLDAAMEDAPLPDALLPDAVMPDAAMPDALLPDAVMPDAAMPAMLDAAVPVGAIDPRCSAAPLTSYADIGTGAPGDPYILCNAAQLDSFLASGPSLSFYRLGQDIVTATWTSRLTFPGTLDGNGHELRLTGFASEPLFASLAGTVQHLRVFANVDATDLDRVGVIAGTASGVVTDVHLTADFVGGQDETGGLVGQCNICRIEDVSVEIARLSGMRMVGGVVGNLATGQLARARVVITQLDSRATTGCAMLGGIVGTAHDGATVAEAYADVGILVDATGAGGIVGDLGLGSQVADVVAEGRVTRLGGSTCTTGIGGLVGTLSGSLQRGWARMPGATAGLADRVQLGAQLSDVAGLTPGLGAPEWTLRACMLGSSITNIAVLDDGFAGSGTLTCAFTAPRTTMLPAYFFLATNTPMSSWDDRAVWSFSGSAMPTLARIPP